MGLKYLLASMDGMTHAAFRSICFEYGADGATTEMIPALSYARAKKKHVPILDELLIRRPEETALAAQILGNTPDLMAAAAKRLELAANFEMIEINMGCPARRVVGSGNGSALLQNPGLAGDIIHAVCDAVQTPVRLKMRLGWDNDHITAPEIARMAQDAGCREIILHGRTRAQMYQDSVQLDAMRMVREAVSIPLYANGAVACAADAEKFANAVGADGVCIGRAALKAPWIFDDIRRLERGEAVAERDAKERIELLLRLVERMCLQKPERFAIYEARKFTAWYLPGLRWGEETCKRINAVESRDAYRGILLDYLDRLQQANDLAVHPELLPEATLDTVRNPKYHSGGSIIL